MGTQIPTDPMQATFIHQEALLKHFGWSLSTLRDYIAGKGFPKAQCHVFLVEAVVIWFRTKQIPKRGRA